MLEAIEKVAELMVTARESFWRSVIEVPPAGRAAVRSNLAVTTEVQNYSIVVAVFKNSEGLQRGTRRRLQPFVGDVWGGTECHCRNTAGCRRGLGGLNVCGLLALRASSDVKRYALAFLERLKATGVNCRVVREEILSTVFRGDEAKAFCVVKPFHCSCCHNASYFRIGDISPLPLG